MKFIILITALLLISPAVFSQANDSLKTTDFEALMKKSKNQKTTAWAFLGGGAAVSSIGIIIGFGEAVDQIGNIFDPNANQKSSNTGEILFYTGVAGMVASIPFFIASSKTRRKAESIHAFIQIKTIPYPGLMANYNKPYPALTIRINL